MNLEEMGLKSNKSNNLNYEITKASNLEPINVELMKVYIDEKRLIQINRVLSKLTKYEGIKHYLLSIYKVGGVLRKLGVQGYLNILYDYYVIKVIEKGLIYNEKK